MIRIETISIRNFRGIRELELDLRKSNFGICGPNGTGKSGVVDAIEFGMSGDVTRLSGQGSLELSVRQHAPHVDERDHPERATVTLTAYIPSLNKTATITRTVKNPRAPIIVPDDPDVNELVREL
jgi:recombinational DNA repair ATPase RecF